MALETASGEEHGGIKVRLGAAKFGAQVAGRAREAIEGGGTFIAAHLGALDVELLDSDCVCDYFKMFFSHALRYSMPRAVQVRIIRNEG
jgi:hypothetical protein